MQALQAALVLTELELEKLELERLELVELELEALCTVEQLELELEKLELDVVSFSKEAPPSITSVPSPDLPM